MSEADRYNFLVERDGEVKALEFAKLTYRSYRLAVLRNGKRTIPTRAVGHTHFASLPQYRKGFIESYLYLKKQVLTSIVV